MTKGAFERLSQREREISALVAKGLTNQQIALKLDPPCAPATVKTHLREIFRALAIESRTTLAAEWVRHEKTEGLPRKNYPKGGIPGGS